MSHIPIRNSEEEDGTIIFFPVKKDGDLTLDYLSKYYAISHQMKLMIC